MCGPLAGKMKCSLRHNTLRHKSMTSCPSNEVRDDVMTLGVKLRWTNINNVLRNAAYVKGCLIITMQEAQDIRKTKKGTLNSDAHGWDQERLLTGSFEVGHWSVLLESYVKCTIC